MSSLKYRILVIVALTLASAWSLWPRTTTVRERDPKTGIMVDREVKRVPLKKGLDLSGGMHLALEVDESRGVVADKSEALDRAIKVVRNRIDQFGVTEPVVQKVGTDRIIVELPGIDDPARAEALIKTAAFLQFHFVDKTQSLDKALSRIDALLRARGEGKTVAAGIKDTAQAKELTELLTPAADSADVAADSAAADSALFAGTADGPFSRLIQPGQMPGEFLVAESDVPTLQRYLAIPEVQAALPPGRILRWGTAESTEGLPNARSFYVLEQRAVIRGDVHLRDAKPSTDPVEGNLVLFELTNEGGRRFGGETAKHIGDNMAIVLDSLVQGQPPVIQDVIRTRGQITMRGKPLQAAQDLALVLRAGALPVPLKVVDQRQIGKSLGDDSIRKGIRAGVLGVILVVLIMVVYYRFSGVLAVAALSLYVLYTLATLAGFDAVLTLPGMAGFVLSIGIAVDANVLIFERIREELDHGKTVRTAIDEGFKHALSAIVDSSVSTMLTAAVLYQFGTGPVRGFAVTLIAGIVASLFTAIFVTRTFYLIWLSRTRGARTLSI